MKPKIVKAFIHAWGLFWAMGLSFYIMETQKAIVFILYAAPFNYFISNAIYFYIFEKPDNTKKGR